jgi:hypothetical protein
MNGANMKKGLFIGFQSEGEPQKDERSAELTQQIKALKKRLEEQDERNKRLSILLFWAGIVVNAAITILITIVLHQFGY